MESKSTLLNGQQVAQLHKEIPKEDKYIYKVFKLPKREFLERLGSRIDSEGVMITKEDAFEHVDNVTGYVLGDCIGHQIADEAEFYEDDLIRVYKR
ncbi:hypothetical protein J2Z48_002991 [Croceifilum oryzae]|uniref:Uncharacterized protein n=1 Tax=Croceifilum oryzae TaxID=1553429 RepID=A0AAJ1TLL7_9BACL|nr:hypothetical protein [Croceifilum oryzae]MDQ0418787.1 hypothetical protein [Croceifilum oryzae]